MQIMNYNICKQRSQWHTQRGGVANCLNHPTPTLIILLFVFIVTNYLYNKIWYLKSRVYLIITTIKLFYIWPHRLAQEVCSCIPWRILRGENRLWKTSSYQLSADCNYQVYIIYFLYFVMVTIFFLKLNSRYLICVYCANY